MSYQEAPTKPYLIRLSTEQDRAFILSSYLKSQRFVNQNRDMRDSVYFDLYKGKAEYIADHTSILVACNPTDEWHAFGYISYSPDPLTIHYCYVKYPYRRAGIATALYEQVNPLRVEIQVTHSCRFFEQLKDQFNLVFNPVFNPTRYSEERDIT